MSKIRRVSIGCVALLAVAGFSACSNAAADAPAAAVYAPQTRAFTFTAVPLLVHEQESQYDFLSKAFSSKGLLYNKEVWGFAPSALTVYAGDTVNVNVMNPGNDPHTFTITELAVSIPIAAAADATGQFVASKVGTFSFFCAIPEHAPYMRGTITVLPARDGV